MDNKEYAGFWIRFAAVLIDIVFMGIVIWIPLTLIYGEQYWLGEEIVNGFWDIILGYIVPFVGTIWFWLKFKGTPGKMALNLEIVDVNTGSKISTGQAIGRYFAYILAAIPLCLGYLWVAFDQKKQGWHDKLANTVVIKNNEKTPVKFQEDV